MGSSLATQRANAEARADIARLKFNERRYKDAYDVLDDDQKRDRRQATIEWGDEEKILPSYKRLQGISRGRDLQRNFAAVKGMLWRLHLHVLGTHPKVMLHTDNESWNKETAHWFNVRWATRADGRCKSPKGGLHLADINRLTLTTVQREGDLLAFFDRTGVVPGGAGKLFHWEADQLVNMRDQDWIKAKPGLVRTLGGGADIDQSNGVIIDAWARPVGYMATTKRGLTTANYTPGDPAHNQITILPAGDARLMSNPWRLNQLRGIADLLGISGEMRDLLEIRHAGLKRMKTQAHLALKVKKEDPDVEAQGRTDSGSASAELAPDSTDASAFKNYKNFEKLTGGAMEYMSPSEDVEAMQLSGDTVDIEKMADWVSISGGFGLGLPRLFSVGKADASYSASRAEAVLAIALFEWWMKWSERYVLDWEAESAISWGAANGHIEAAPAGWDDQISWQGWPVLAPMDPARSARAKETQMKMGEINFESLLGPDWETIIQKTGAMIKTARDAGFWPDAIYPPPVAKTGATADE